MPSITVFSWMEGTNYDGEEVDIVIKAPLWGSGPHDLGKGYTGYVVRSSRGLELIAEATTGGIIGRSLDAVRADIKVADSAFLARLLEEAKTYLAMAELGTPDDFWAAWERTIKAGR